MQTQSNECRRRTAVSLLAMGLVVSTAAWADEPTVVFVDDFEAGNAQGWTFSAETCWDYINGHWEIGDPNGTVHTQGQAQPEDAYLGTGCAFTAQNSSPGVHDVDSGVVWMTSPPINLAGATSATLSYARWYYLGEPGEDPADYFSVEVRPDPASAWVLVEFLGPLDLANAWTPRSFALDSLIPLTDTVQLRFAANDGCLKGTVLEVAVDEVIVTAEYGCSGNDDCAPSAYCSAAGACEPYGDGDFDDDGDVDLLDISAFQSCFGSSAGGACAPGNLSGDYMIDLADLTELVGRLEGPR